MDRLRLRWLLLSALTRELGALVIGLSDLTMLHSELTGLCPDLKVDDAALRFDGKLKFREVNIKSIVYINYIDWLPFNLVVGHKVVDMPGVLIYWVVDGKDCGSQGHYLLVQLDGAVPRVTFLAHTNPQDCRLALGEVNKLVQLLIQ